MDDKNQQAGTTTNTSSPLTTGQPATSSGGTPPPILTGEEPPAPPLPASQPPDQPKPPTIAPSPYPEEEMPPAMGPNEVIPPIITPPQKSRKKLIGGILAVLILAAGVVGGTVLVGRSQELREKAAIGECADNPVTPPEGFKWTALCDQTCTTNDDCPAGDETRDDRGAWCYGFEEGKRSRCLRLDKTAAEPLQPVVTEPLCTTTPGQECLSSNECNASGGQRGTGKCDSGICCVVGTKKPADGTGKEGQCTEDPGPAPKATDGKDIHSQGCAVVASFVSKWGKDAGKRWALEHNLETECTGGLVKACDGQSLQTQSTSVIETFVATGLAGSCKKWADEHNTAVNNCTQANACNAVNVYKHPYGAGDLVAAGAKLTNKDALKICAVTSSGASAAQVRINNGSWQDAGEKRTRGSAVEFCKQYDVLPDDTSLKFEGRSR